MSQAEYRELCGKGDVAFKLPTGSKEATMVEQVKAPPVANAKSSIRASPEQ